MSRTVTIASQDALFKNMYGKAGTSLVNKKAPLSSVLMKNKRVDFVGSQFVQPVRFTSSLGLGYRASGQNLPKPQSARRESAVFPAKRAYATAEYDREAIVASRNDEGAFAKVTLDEAISCIEGHQLHMVERALFGDSQGTLGQIDDASITGAGTEVSPWGFDLLAGDLTYSTKGKWFQRGQRVDLFTTAGVYQMTIEIRSVSTNQLTKVVSLTAITLETGSAVSPTDNDVLYWQGNRGQEIVGLRAIAPVTAGTLYGIDQTLNPEFRGLLKSVSGALQYDDFNEAIEQLSEEIEAPNLAVCSHSSLALLKNLSEDHKRYNASEMKSSDGKIGFKGIEAMSSEGSFPVIASQMCPEGEVFMMNTANMQLVMRQDFGWFDDDGTILLRDQDKDVYNARYGGYFELFCSKPNSVLRLYGFSV